MRALKTDYGAVMENDVGLAIEILRVGEGFGIGRISFKGKRLNEEPIPCVVHEDNIWENSSEPFSNSFYPGLKWSPAYQAEELEKVALDDNEVYAILRRRTYFDLRARICLPKQKSCILFEYELRPIVPIKHELFVPLPLPNFEFVSYPYETPITPPFSGIWTIYPEPSFSPFLFGKGDGLYIGLGYHLSQERLFEGKFQFVPILDQNLPLRIYFPQRKFGVYRWNWARNWGGMRTDSYILRFIYSVGETLHDCISAYREFCGYDTSVPNPPHELEEALIALMRGYKDTKACCDIEIDGKIVGKAYHMQIEIPRGSSPPTHGYGAFIPLGANMHLALQLYKFYRLHPQEVWAKERAIDVAKFFVYSAEREGYKLPLLYDPRTKSFRTFTDRMTEIGFIYSTTPQAVGALSLHKLAKALEEEEGRGYSHWKDVAIRLGMDLAEKTRRNGRLAREYDALGNEGGFAPTPWQLIAFDYFSEEVGHPFDEARDVLEEWNIKNFIETMNFYGSSIDDGALSMPHPLNHDCFDPPILSFYFLQRYLKTGDEEKLRISLDLADYYWLCTVPTQPKGFRRVAKGLNIEQDSYRMYDVPFHSWRFLAGLPKLSDVSGDPFYQEFFEMLAKVQLHYQLPLDHPFPAFHIGLAPSPDEDAPVDDFGEPNIAFIAEFAPLFFDTMTHPWVRCEGGE